MSQGPRLLRPDRVQLRWDMVDLNSQLPPDHPARIVWAFVDGSDLSEFYDQVKARDDRAGRPASDPAVLLAVWLYATLDDVGSARAIARLCRDHSAYRWLCGGVPVNHDMLSGFRREGAALLDGMLTRSLTGLIAEGLVTVEEATIDGTKVQSRAGHNSMASRGRLARLEEAVGARVARLRSEMEHDGGAGRRRLRGLQAARTQAERLQRARERLEELEKEKVERAKTHRVAEEKKDKPKVSTSDPEVRRMRMADGATRPAWNVQVATCNGFVVGIEPTDRRNDSGLAEMMVGQIKRRCGRAPHRLLADGTAITIDEIASLSRTCPSLLVYSPVPQAKPDEEITPAAARNRRWQLKHEPAAVKEWRARMATHDGQIVYRRRKLTELVHARMKNRGFGRMLVHGIAKVRSICMLHALANNLVHTHWHRGEAA